jgi:hypothetical protein
LEAFDMGEAEEFDIARNIREIEALKIGILAGVSEMYQLMQDGGAGREALGEALAGIMFSAMELAGRVGVTMEDLDRRVTRRIRAKRLGADTAQ